MGKERSPSVTIQIMSNQHSLVTYQADSALDYLWVNWLTTPSASAVPKHRWIDYPYNETHTLHHHTLTNEMIYKPIRFLTSAFNSTHRMVTDTLHQTIEYKPIPQPPSAAHDIIMHLLIFLFLSAVCYLIFVAKDPFEPTVRTRTRTPSCSPGRYRNRRVLFH